VINLAWDHNSYYQERLLRALPARCGRVSALHHMDLPVVLPRLAASLRPGGLLIAVALHRLEIPQGLPAGRRCRREMYRRHAAQPPMPMMNPELPLRQVRAQAAAALPGSRVRWLAHWRYELTWRKLDR
jgi:hypothetical protein